MKKEINVLEYATQIMRQLQQGVLISTKSGDRLNAMTISWGMLGIEWGKPVFITFIREGRFTRKMLEENPNFTVCIPYGKPQKKILAVCGAKSGRDLDKIKTLGLTPEEPECNGVPGYQELPLTLECKVTYRQLQTKDNLNAECLKFYPKDVDSSFHGSNKDFHIAFYGEILKAYIIE